MLFGKQCCRCHTTGAGANGTSFPTFRSPDQRHSASSSQCQRFTLLLRFSADAFCIFERPQVVQGRKQLAAVRSPVLGENRAAGLENQTGVEGCTGHKCTLPILKAAVLACAAPYIHYTQTAHSCHSPSSLSDMRGGLLLQASERVIIASCKLPLTKSDETTMLFKWPMCKSNYADKGIFWSGKVCNSN
jgi:hypothetical protein